MLVELRDETPMAVLGPDDFCGEEALLLEVPRNAYVRASEAEGGLQLLALSNDDIEGVKDALRERHEAVLEGL